VGICFEICSSVKQDQRVHTGILSGKASQYVTSYVLPSHSGLPVPSPRKI